METFAVKYDLDDRHVERWRNEVCDQLLDADTQLSAGQNLGVNLGVTAIAGIVHLDCKTTHSGLTLGRDRVRVVRSSGRETMGLSVVLSGEAQILTESGEHVVRAGDLCLLSSHEVFTKRLSANYHEQFLYLPIPVALALGRSVPVMGQRVIVAPRRGLGAVLADTVSSLARSRREITQPEWNTALGAVFELAAGVFGRPDPERLIASARDAQRERAMRYLEANLADPELSPVRIAAALGISPRYLHLLFETGTSVSATILGRRLERCRTAISDPAQRHRAVSEIAFSWGFNDAAHFSRTFRARFGVSPSELRGAR